MEKHLLLTVSCNPDSFYALRYAGRLFSNPGDVRFTLLYIAPTPPAPDITASDVADEVRRHHGDMRRVHEQCVGALKQARYLLLDQGYKPGQVRTKMEFSRFGPVLDIIQEAEEGLYDAVVLGRRGLTWLEERMDESISKGMIMGDVTTPIWICRQPEWGRKNVLICMDGSKEALRVTDHVGFLLEGQDHEVTLYYVKRPGDDDSRIRAWMARAREVLQENGFPDSRVHVKVEQARDVIQAVVAQAEQGGYAAVATGRTEAERGGFFNKVFMGSVSMNLLYRLKGAALWVCK